MVCVACQRAKGRHVQLPWLVYRCVEHFQKTCRCGLFVNLYEGCESDARLYESHRSHNIFLCMGGGGGGGGGWTSEGMGKSEVCCST